MDPQLYYDALTDVYRRLFGHDWHLGYWLHAVTLPEAAARMNELLLRRLPVGPGAQVLDLGCGMGGGSCLIAASKQCRVVGVSNSRAGLELAVRFAEERGVANAVRFEFAEALQLPFPDASFDAVWSCEAIHNVIEKDRLAAEIARQLGPGGAFVIGDLFLLRDAGDADANVAALRGYNFHLQTADEWIAALGRQGAIVEESVNVGHHVFPSFDACTRICREEAARAAPGLERTILERSAEATSRLADAFAAGSVGWGIWSGVKASRRGKS